MPKETVHYGREFGLIPIPDSAGVVSYMYNNRTQSMPDDIAEGEILDREPTLSVYWSRGGDSPDGEGFVHVELEMTPNLVKRHLEGREDDSLVQLIHFSTDGLSRSELNNLIRVLKRARNSAYGADE